MSDARKVIISFFEKGTFPYKGNVFKIKKEESEEESEKNRLEKIKDDYKKSIEYIENESKSINYELFGDYVDFVLPSASAKKLFETKDKNKNNELVKLIKVRWSNLKDKTEKISTG